MQSLVKSGLVEATALADPSEKALAAGLEAAPGAHATQRYEELLELGLDAVVIATPSALHARQCVMAFERGLAVFCQKPLARTLVEARAVVLAAQAADRLLRVDLSYRQTRALERVRRVVQSGELGDIYAAQLTFHNAYGPDKAWANDPALAGGGCLMDLGVHLVDAALWVLGFPAVEASSARLYKQGQRLCVPCAEVEDFALAQLATALGQSIDLQCSWRSSIGCGARIRAEFFGTRGSVALQNVDGSFFDFTAERYTGDRTEQLCGPPDDWGGSAATAWAAELVASRSYRDCSELLRVASVLDAFYGRAELGSQQAAAS